MNTSFLSFLPFSIHGHVPHFLVLLVCKTIEAQWTPHVFSNFLPFSIHDNVPHFLVLFVFKTIGAHTFCGTFHFSFFVCIFHPTTQTPSNAAIQSYLSSEAKKDLRRYEHLILFEFLIVYSDVEKDLRNYEYLIFSKNLTFFNSW